MFKKYDFNLNVLSFDFDWLTLKIFKCIKYKKKITSTQLSWYYINCISKDMYKSRPWNPTYDRKHKEWIILRRLSILVWGNPALAWLTNVKQMERMNKFDVITLLLTFSTRTPPPNNLTHNYRSIKINLHVIIKKSIFRFGHIFKLMI